MWPDAIRPRLAPGAGRFAVPPLALAVPAAVLAPPIGAALVALGAAVVWFYRDPERTPPADVTPEGRTTGVGRGDADGPTRGERDGSSSGDPGGFTPGDATPAASGPEVVLAPCDGHVSVVREEDGRVRVGTFMSPADVHVTRAPVAGVVDAVEHVPGGHWPAFSKESERNERLHVRFLAGDGTGDGAAPELGRDSDPRSGPDGERGDAVAVETTMIAGALARRITSYVDGGATLAAGQRLGHIAFGSRTDVLLPPAFDADDLRVSTGDRVRAGETVLARLE